MIMKNEQVSGLSDARYTLDEIQAMLVSGGYVQPDAAAQIKRQIAWLKRNSTEVVASRNNNAIIVMAIVVLAALLFMKGKR